MAIALVWNDAKSFKQHLEQMRMFRQSHHSNPEGRTTMLKNLPTWYDIHPPNQTEVARGFITVRGKPALIPVWEIELPKNSQN